MNIPTAKYLKLKARNRLESGKEPKAVVLWYSGISTGLTLLVTAIRYALSKQLSQTGGLSNIGSRSILSTIDNVLPIIQNVLLICLSLGYIAAMLRISRHQYASPKTLKAGAERFWPLLLSRILQGLIYAAIAFGVSYLALAVYMLSPFSNSFMELALPMINEGTLSPELLLNDDALMATMMHEMSPVFIIYAVLFLPIVLFVSYRFRMTDYIIIDQPGCSAANAMRQSRMLMRGNGMNLFKIDLSFWWYHLLRTLATVLLYADLILAAFGISLPSETVTFFGTSIIFLAADFAINYYFLNHYTVTHALAYNSLLPKEENKGVVLGNIFQM